MNLLKSPVSVICRFLSMKSKRQTNMSAFVHWTNNRTECICSSGVGYHMRLWDTLLNVISTHKAFHFILLLQNDTKTEKNMKLCSTQSPSWEVNSGKVFASYRSDHFNNTLTVVSSVWVTRKSKGNNTISDVNVSGKSFNFPLSNLTHLDKPITQTVAENIYLCSLYKCFTFKPL